MNFGRYVPILLLATGLLAGCSESPDVDGAAAVDATWTVELPAELGHAQESVANGNRVMVVGDDGVAVLSAGNGEVLWSISEDEVPFELNSTFLYANSVVAIGSEGYIGWDINTKEEIFRSETAVTVYDWAAFHDNLIIVESRSSVAVMKGFDPESGDEQWQHEMDHPTFNLIPEGARDGYYTNAAVLPSDGELVALWAKSADDPVHGQIRDVSTGKVDAVVDAATGGSEKNQTFFSGPERFSEWHESVDGAVQITTYETVTGAPVWDATVDIVEGWLFDSAILVENNGSPSALSAISGDVLGDLGDPEDLILAADGETAYLSHFDGESVEIRAQSIEGADTEWSQSIESNSDSDATTHVWSKISGSHLLYHYRTTSDDEASESKTVAAHRDTGALVWLSGESITPLFVDNGSAVATCAENSCPSNSSSVAYFDLK